MNQNKVGTIILFLFLILQIAALPGKNVYCQSSGNSIWIRKTDAPQGCVFPHMPPQIIGDKVFSLQTKNYIVDKLLIYNIKTDSWNSKATSLITNRHHFATAVYNNKLYVAGGCLGENDSVIHVRTGSMEMYDPDTDKWVSKKSMLTPRAGFQLVVHNEKIYAIGGFDKDSIPVKTIEVYDPDNDAWNVKTTAPWNNSLTCFGAVVFNHKIYILGESNRTPVFMVYNPNQNTFATLTPMYMDRYAYGVTLAGNEIFVVGGAQQNPVKTVAAYNIAKNTWNKYPDIPETHAYPGIMQYNNRIYCIGGVGPEWNWGNPYNSVFEYEIKYKQPYTSDQPLPYPKLFEIPNTSVAQSITFTPDGTSFYFVTQEDNQPVVIKYSTYTEGNWSNPKVSSFCGQYSVETPFITPDGSKMFFTQSGESNDIWVCEKDDTGWSAPGNAGTPINSPGWDSSPTLSANGNFYFSSNRNGRSQIYCSRWEDNKYSNSARLENSINKYNIEELYMAPDESYILFGNNVSGSNQRDIYISFKSNNSWTDAKSVGLRVNSSAYEGRPYVSPDGNYLFFTRHINNSPLIFQIDWKPILDSLRSVLTSTKENTLLNKIDLNLEQNYPNPFNPETVISYQLPVSSNIELKVFNMLGQEVAALVNKEQSAGSYEVKFSAGSCGDGSNLPSGIYFYRMDTGNYTQTNKMILIR